jgi:hypothetical protein
MPTTTTPPGASLLELIEAIAAECRSRHTAPRAVVDEVLERHWPSVGAYDQLVREGAVHLAALHLRVDDDVPAFLLGTGEQVRPEP